MTNRQYIKKNIRLILSHHVILKAPKSLNVHWQLSNSFCMLYFQIINNCAYPLVFIFEQDREIPLFTQYPNRIPILLSLHIAKEKAFYWYLFEEKPIYKVRFSIIRRVCFFSQAYQTIIMCLKMKNILCQIYKAVGSLICNLCLSITITVKNVKLNLQGGLEDIDTVTFFLLKTKIITSSMISYMFFLSQSCYLST